MNGGVRSVDLLISSVSKMTTAASLTYKDNFAWGLRVNPSFEELAQSIKDKPVKVPEPDRNAKWFATSVYRSYMLDAARRFHDYEHLKLDYNQSGAQLPQRTAMVHPAAEGDDPAWQNVQRATENAQDHDAYELAFAAMEAEHRQQASQTRAEQLGASHTLATGHWFMDANHTDLDEAGVEHDAPTQRPRFTSTPLPAPVAVPAAGGQLGLIRQFPTFEELNLSQPRALRGHTVRPQASSSSSSYDSLRDNALGR